MEKLKSIKIDRKIALLVLIIIFVLFIICLSYIYKTSYNEGHIKYEEGYGNYIDNMISIYFVNDIPESRRLEIINKINGKVVNQNSRTNRYDIVISPHSLNKLHKLCEKIEKKYPDEIDLAICIYVDQAEAELQ